MFTPKNLRTILGSEVPDELELGNLVPFEEPPPNFSGVMQILEKESGTFGFFKRNVGSVAVKLRKDKNTINFSFVVTPEWRKRLKEAMKTFKRRYPEVTLEIY